jgi:hypothetical protein
VGGERGGGTDGKQESNPGEAGRKGEGEGAGKEEEEEAERKNMLVFDFGGGTLDVTIMEIAGMSFKVRAVD